MAALSSRIDNIHPRFIYDPILAYLASKHWSFWPYVIDAWNTRPEKDSRSWNKWNDSKTKSFCTSSIGILPSDSTSGDDDSWANSNLASMSIPSLLVEDKVKKCGIASNSTSWNPNLDTPEIYHMGKGSDAYRIIGNPGLKQHYGCVLLW